MDSIDESKLDAATDAVFALLTNDTPDEQEQEAIAAAEAGLNPSELNIHRVNLRHRIESYEHERAHAAIKDRLRRGGVPLTGFSTTSGGGLPAGEDG